MYDIVQIFDNLFKLFILFIIIDLHPELNENNIEEKKKILNISLNIYISLISLYFCNLYVKEGIISPFTYINQNLMSVIYLFISFKIFTLNNENKNNIKNYLQIILPLILILNNKCGYLIVLSLISLILNIFENIDNNLFIKRFKILVFEKVNMPVLFTSILILLFNCHKISKFTAFIYLLFLLLLIPYNIKSDYLEIKKYNKLYNEKKSIRTRYMGTPWVEVLTFHSNGIP